MNASDIDVGADVVEGDAPAEVADPLDGAQQLRGPGGERTLGDLQDDPQLAGARRRRWRAGRPRGAVSSTSGSTLTNTVSGASRPCSTAPRKAAARQTSSSSASRPASRAAANSASGRASGPSGPRASAS